MFDGNTYHFQTKNPGRLRDFLDLFPGDATLGTTIETNRVIRDVSSAAPGGGGPVSFLLAVVVLGSLGVAAWVAVLWVCMRRHRDEWEATHE
ncbi:MAG: hypothetical protein PHZ19_09930 [Candidatus Thermoplasmatota archaeon]|nr:hypothetical protein [Candidatus Thermoplasmatota archaeon]